MEHSHNEYEDDGFEIRVVVINPEIRGTNKYVVYTLKGEDKLGEFELTRRYSDFDLVRNLMLSRWPGCYVPALPSKKVVGNMDIHFIEDRRHGLQEFVRILSTIKHLWYSEEGQILVRSQAAQIDKALAPLAPTNANIIQRYEQIFKNLSGKEINVSIEAKINQFSIYLKRIVPTLRTFKEVSLNSLNVRRKFNEQAYTLLQFMLPQYEKNCLRQYLPSEESLIFLNSKDPVIAEVQGKLKEYNTRHDFEEAYQSFRQEKREVEAFLQTLKVKEDFESAREKAKQKVRDLELEKQKIMAGKTTLTTISSMMKSKDKEFSLREVEQETEKAQRSVDELTLICDISTVLLGYIEIDKFKKQRQIHYFSQVKKTAKFELEYARLLKELWQTISQNESISKAMKSEEKFE